LLPTFKNIEFFKDRGIEDRTILDVIATSSYEFIRKNQIVFKQGEKGEKFYLVMYGKVAIKGPTEEYGEAKLAIK
jgi:CRP-like cAMP-binding protein